MHLLAGGKTAYIKRICAISTYVKSALARALNLTVRPAKIWQLKDYCLVSCKRGKVFSLYGVSLKSPWRKGLLL